MKYDAIVIGGGPGGSTVATLLARGGRRVLLLEKEHFPRFHIGESMLPYNNPIFEEMGVMSELESQGFPMKLGAQFHLSNSSKGLKLCFRRGKFTRHHFSIQVERAKFDHILLKHTAASGAEVREGWTVIKTSSESKPQVSGAHVSERARNVSIPESQGNTDGVTVTARDDSGKTETFEASFLIDASGRANFTGNQENLRVIHPHLKKLSIFGYFEGVKLDEGDTRWDTLIVRYEDKWFWLIPLSESRISVGLVMDQEEFAKAKLPPAEIFERVWRGSSHMRGHMENSRPLGPMQTTSDFSYYNRRLVGPRVLRVGDAAGFMDPIFSAGVYLAMYSGRLAAHAVDRALAQGNDGARLFAKYEKRAFRAMRCYWELVEGFYTKPFMDIFMQPRDKVRLLDGMVAIFAGELDGGFRINWRRWLFFLLVKIQKKRGLVPPLSYHEPESAGKAEIVATNAVQIPVGR